MLPLSRVSPSKLASALRCPLLAAALLLPCSAHAADLVLDGTAVSLGGTHTYGVVSLTNGAKVLVPPYDGTTGTGSLVLKATNISVDATSSITAKGSGYQARLCLDGNGPAASSLSGGRGGCGVRDSGGGGGHLGAGGTGTKDCPASGCTAPNDLEESCGAALAGAGACLNMVDCRNNDGLPTSAGQAFRHSPYAVEFGAAGGDKGCRDSDGFTPSSGTSVALAGGDGGGRIVLVAVSAAQTGQLKIDGVVGADGARGCGSGNDSGGGGAGGSVLLLGDTVAIGPTARISAAGGRGGDQQPKCLACSVNADCSTGQSCVSGRCSPCNCTPCTSNAQCLAALGQSCKALGGAFGNVCADAANQCTPIDPTYDEAECKGTQNSGACDDCAGGGGGGEVRVLSRVASLSPLAHFNVRGGPGGVCPVCTGLSAGSSGELQLDGAFVGEVCDGADNDFNGSVDDGLPQLDCAGSMLPSCVNGVPQQCPTNAPACIGPVTDTRPRFLVILDSSSAMLRDAAGSPTFGDGSVGHLGVDTSSDADAVDGNNSRLSVAKAALEDALAAFTSIDFALARFHQDVSVNRSCQTASWMECQSLCCSYDDPRNNTTPAFPSSPGCNLAALYPASGYPAALNANLNAGWASQSDCTNYAGSCGSPRRGADVLVGFGKPLPQALMWLDGRETSFNSSVLPGDHCDWNGGGDCELRANGPRPLAAAMEAAADFLRPTVQCDAALPCRRYGVILITGGAESCSGDPLAAAAALRGSVPGISIPTYVVAFNASAAEGPQLNATAAAGGTGAAFWASDRAGLRNALAAIATANSARFESCNDLDDNCNGLVDEDFPDKGVPCDDGRQGLCRGTGARVCNAAGNGTACQITAPGAAPSVEECNGLDDDCDGLVDDDGICATCTPSPERCNRLDDDCDGATDESPVDEFQPCGLSLGECSPGITVCGSSGLTCEGGVGPAAESCNGLDDDCDGLIDGMSADCYTGPADTSAVGLCRDGLRHCSAAPGSGVPAWSACLGEVRPSPESCDGLDNDCDGTTDELVSDGLGHATGEACCAFGDKCGAGECTSGQYRCAGSQVECSGGAGPAPESCNGRDDDCNGAVDDLPGLEATCAAADGCAGTLLCDPVSGDLTCAPSLGGLELCNGVDDDCDGAFDEQSEVAQNDPAIGQECLVPAAPRAELPCKAGRTSCVAGTVRCLGAITPETDSCDGLDNDCDGVTDSPGTCPQGLQCHDGGCLIPCAAGEAAACPGQFTCVEGYCAFTPGTDGGVVADAGVAPTADAAGCSCQAGSSSPASAAGLLVLLLGAFARPARRKQPARRVSARATARALLLAALCLAALAGCDPDPSPVESTDAGAACAADLQSDSANCGRCGHVCELYAAFSKCVAGECAVDSCAPGYTDLDGSAASGCEYACAVDGDGAELCDGRDNDCDGDTDEDFDLSAHLDHCGACDHHCALQDATSACGLIDGVIDCVVAECAAGFADLDERASNGCEYECPVSPPAVETCNGLDDDCDGVADEGDPGAGQPCEAHCPGGVCRGECAPGVTRCLGTALACVGGIPAALEICDGQDNDCDGLSDDGFDLERDRLNCGACGHACALANAVGGCLDGECVVTACAAGFASLDGSAETGCEYACPVHPPRAESCNGLDDDCNGVIDDPAEMAASKPPASLCNQRPGTPCAETELVCAGAAGWGCAYGPGTELDAAGRPALVESRCDGLDGNCDGQSDESFVQLGAECDNGLLGACRDSGRYRCDPADPAKIACDLSPLPDPVPGAPTVELCNGLDDDCDGIVDDGIVDDMVLIADGPAAFHIDRFEASRPDATADSPGLREERRCSVAGVIPWTFTVQAEAAAACAASGARLCTSAELQAACEGGASNAYPYGQSYQPLTCNGVDLDGIPGGADDDLLLPTGSSQLTACATPQGVHDLSGNAAEWTSEVAGNTGPPQNLAVFATKGGSYKTPASGLTCQFGLSRYAANAILPALGFRCCRD